MWRKWCDCHEWCFDIATIKALNAFGFKGIGKMPRTDPDAPAEPEAVAASLDKIP
jgi:hypothetical protein